MTESLIYLDKKFAEIFGTGPARRPRHADPFRRQRAKARALAAEIGATIEALPASECADKAWNVWPPALLADDADPHAGDHYCADWSEVLGALEDYAALVSKAGDDE